MDNIVQFHNLDDNLQRILRDINKDEIRQGQYNTLFEQLIDYLVNYEGFQEFFALSRLHHFNYYHIIVESNKAYHIIKKNPSKVSFKGTLFEEHDYNYAYKCIEFYLKVKELLEIDIPVEEDED